MEKSKQELMVHDLSKIPLPEEKVQAKAFKEGTLNLDMTPELRKHIGDEVFLYSCKIVKYNQYGWRNTRTLCLTQDSLLMLKNKCKDLRRRENIDRLLGITVSYHEESREMVLHFNQNGDIRLTSPHFRRQILDTVKMFYAAKTRDNLPIYGVRQKSLAQYHTTENEIKKGVSRIPLPMARLSEGDLIQLNSILEKSLEIHVLDETAIYEKKRLKEMSEEFERQIEYRNSLLELDLPVNKTQDSQ
jgi:hypothetical protein